MSKQEPRNLLSRLRYHAWFLVLLWTGCIAASLLWNWRQQQEQVLRIAENNARVTFENDVLYRKWVAKQGGVYVPVTGQTPVNPYLQVPNRDVATASGLSLTLINPAYMARLINQMAIDVQGSRGHITSLKPIRPENRADDWEAAALRTFEQGAKEARSVEAVGKDDYLRLMRPFVAEKACLKCHAAQGYKEGDVRGGISVSVPLRPLWAIEQPHVTVISLAHLLLWTVGVAGIVVSKRGLTKQVIAREKTEMVLRARLRLSELAQRGGMDQLIQAALNDAEALSGSSVGYFHFVSDDQQHVVLHAWSDRTLKAMCCPTGQKGRQCSIQDAGVWVDCLRARAPVVHNDYTALPHKKGLPAGHLPIVRHLSVPILRGGAVVAVMGVGNKVSDYTGADVAAVQELASLTMDLVAYKQYEESLRQTADELRRSNHELEQFAYLTSHDLQEPLRQVRAFVQRLGDSYGERLDGRATEYMRFIVDGTARMTALIQDLLGYSRVGAGPNEPQTAPSSEALATALANLRTDIDQAHARITHGELPIVTADATQLVQLFQNLVGNAVKFRRDGVAPEIHVGARRDGPDWLLWVQDNGIGIDPQYAGKIFEIFQRLHARDKYPGTGIGLAICKKIVEQHGGRIWVESEPGQGTSFFFTLPEDGGQVDK